MWWGQGFEQCSASTVLFSVNLLVFSHLNQPKLVACMSTLSMGKSSEKDYESEVHHCVSSKIMEKKGGNSAVYHTKRMLTETYIYIYISMAVKTR